MINKVKIACIFLLLLFSIFIISCGNESNSVEGTADNSGGLNFVGIGVSVTDMFNIYGGLVKFEMQHDGSYNFIVWLLDYNTGDKIELLANEIGEFSGTVATGLDPGKYILSINADGNWHIIVTEIS